ncbi:MAG: NAD-dependent epimerase/dehydratase family protein [Lachnospiraceae bacterium]|nr:NAD-dependent epimerase/dehydratase family protein [Lachnospiraceae bacterium]
MRRVLITGANSYIGVSFEEYVRTHYSSEISISTIDMRDGSWKQKDFSEYDVVFHVAGIAHVDLKKADTEIRNLYYSVNTDLAIDTARKAKKEKVSQFIFMSSAIIYGESAPYGVKKVITAETSPAPANYYGDSKWQADKGIQELENQNFKVCILRPPMIYGRNSKGNYPLLSKIARKMPVFPDVENERSMLYIENLCEFLCQIIMRGKRGIFWPQNAEYTKTSDMVKMISNVLGHRIFVTKALNWTVAFASHFPGKVSQITNKAFGNLSYDQKMSQYDFVYQCVDLNTSIERTEA